MSDAPQEPLADPLAEPLEGSPQEEEEKKRLSLEVKVEEPGACQRHITVTVPREDITRYFEEAVDELLPKAEVPGFRPGRAPRKLVATRFRNQLQDQVKGAVLMDSMQQVTEEADFSAISEPDFDYAAVDLPEDGPLTFEFDLEVRPEFTMPNWKGLKLERPVKVVGEEDVDKHLKNVLARYAKTETVNEPAQAGDTLLTSIRFTRDGQTLSKLDDLQVKVQPVLSFANAELPGFDKLAVGAKAGSQLTAKLTISDEDPREDLCGAEVEANINVHQVRRQQLPKLTPSFLDQIGGFEDEEELRDAVRKELDRQLAYFQQRRIREQISALLTESADWQLPPDLLKRQASRELERAVMELEASGFTNEQINAHANELRRNSLDSTAAALKEHFIFERIAEEQTIDASPEDYELEVQLIAEQRNETPRRVRARMEKRGQMDSLRNQIVERKVIQAIMDEAQFKDMPFQDRPDDTFAVDHAIGHQGEIPEAAHGEAESLRQPADHT